MIPTRRAQPYRQGAREPGAALQAMLRGTTANGVNPASFDNQRRQMAAGGVREILQGTPPQQPAQGGLQRILSRAYLLAERRGEGHLFHGS